jgi:hypothetical protein
MEAACITYHRPVHIIGDPRPLSKDVCLDDLFSRITGIYRNTALTVAILAPWHAESDKEWVQREREHETDGHVPLGDQLGSRVCHFVQLRVRILDNAVDNETQWHKIVGDIGQFC